jgi:hypothetical protein
VSLDVDKGYSRGGITKGSPGSYLYLESTTTCSPSVSSRTTMLELVALFVVGYWTVCRVFRWRTATFIANKFDGRDPYSLSTEEAHWIVRQLLDYEMCFIARFATAFALFRTYGIPTIATTLLK